MGPVYPGQTIVAVFAVKDGDALTAPDALPTGAVLASGVSSGAVTITLLSTGKYMASGAVPADAQGKSIAMDIAWNKTGIGAGGKMINFGICYETQGLPTAPAIEGTIDDENPTVNGFTLNSGFLDVNDVYNKRALYFLTGTYAGLYFRITDYDGPTRRVTLSPAMVGVPANGDAVGITGLVV